MSSCFLFIFPFLISASDLESRCKISVNYIYSSEPDGKNVSRLSRSRPRNPPSHRCSSVHSTDYPTRPVNPVRIEMTHMSSNANSTSCQATSSCQAASIPLSSIVVVIFLLPLLIYRLHLLSTSLSWNFDHFVFVVFFPLSLVFLLLLFTASWPFLSHLRQPTRTYRPRVSLWRHITH